MILPGSSSAGATRSASPASMALLGMLSNLAEAGSCTSANPAFSLMARSPIVPSEPMPERMTPMLCILPVLGQGAEEKIDGETQAAGSRRLEQVQHAVQNGHVLVGWDHIDAVRLDPHPVLDLEYLHPGGALEQFGHDPLVGRVQVLDDDKGHAAVFGHMPQELLQRLQPAGRGADADDGKRTVLIPGRNVFL